MNFNLPFASPMAGVLLRVLLGYLSVCLCLVLGYLLGSVSPAYLVGLMRGYDVRESGSGNAGASNTVILAGKFAGLMVALADIFKAWAAWKLCQLLFPGLRVAGILGGISAIMGHMFPVFLDFRGGKGFACMGGVVLAYDPKALLILFFVALFIGILSRYVCVVTTAMSVLWPLYYLADARDWLGALLLLIPALPIFLKHLPNFRRIALGEELRLSFLWKKEDELKRIGRG